MPAVSFSGSRSQYIQIPKIAAYDNLTSFTAEAWIKPVGGTGLRAIVSQWGDGGPGRATWRLYLDEANKLCFSTHNGSTSAHYTALTPNVPDGVWSHVAIVREGNKARLYLNGQLIAEFNNIIPPQSTSSYPLMIGRDVTAYNAFSGLIAEVRLWNMARTNEEIARNYNTVLFGNESGLIGYWRLNEGSGSVIADQSPMKNDGTIYSATWSSEQPPLVAFYLIQDGNDIKTILEGNVLSSPMTSNNTPAPYVVSASSEYAGVEKAYHAFDGNPSTYWGTQATGYGWLQLDLGEGNQKKVTKYRVTIRNSITTQEAPKDWTLQGSNDGANWDVLDTRTNQTAWSLGETRSYAVTNPGLYRYYKLDVTNSNSGTSLSIAQLELLEDQIITIGSIPATEDMFLNYALNLSRVTDATLRGLTNPVLLVYAPNQLLVPKVSVTGVPLPRLVLPVDDISLASVDQIKSFTLSANEFGDGIVRVIVSVDSGATWKAWNGSAWIDVNHNDLDDVKSKGMTPVMVSSISSADWMTLVGNAKTIRFAYYIEISARTDIASVDALTAQFDMKGYWEGAIPGLEYVCSYPDNTIVQVILYATGNFKINY